MKTRLSRALCLLLITVLAIGLLPTSVFAAASETFVYGTYDETGTWNPIAGDSTRYTTNDGVDLVLQKLASSSPTNPDEYTITLSAQASVTVPKTTSEELKSAAVVLVLDESGSMGWTNVYDEDGNYLGNGTSVLKDVCRDFIDDYKTNDPSVQRLVAVVGFESSGTLHLGWTDVNTAEGYANAIASIDAIYSGGGTNMGRGLSIANTLLSSAPAGCPTFVVAMTDGDDHSPNTARAEADAAKAAGATVYTVGVGVSGWAIQFLKEVASPGCDFSAEDFTGLQGLFDAIGQEITNVVAALGRGVTVTDPMAPGISVVSIGDPNRFTTSDNKTYTWTLGSAPYTSVDNGDGTVTYTYTYTISYIIKFDITSPDFANNPDRLANEITQINISEDEKYQFPVPQLNAYENVHQPEEEKKEEKPFIFPRTGVAVLKVTDSATGKPVEGLQYDLYRLNTVGGKDNKVGETHVTKADGQIIVSNATTGYYYWLQTEVAEGYAADTGKHVFNVVGPDYVTTEVALTPYTAPAAEIETPVVPETPAIEEAPAVEETPAVLLPFVDVDADDPDVLFVYENGIMNGVADDKFAPADDLSRAMVVTILYRIENEPAVEFKGTFSDVADGQWYSEAVEWAAANGVVNGYTDGTFGPNDSVTCEQLAAILNRYAVSAGITLTEGTSVRDDVSEYAASAYAWALVENIVSASAVPGAAASRLQVAAAMHAFCTLLAD